MGIKSWYLKICHVLNCVQQANQQILTCSNLTKETLEKDQKEININEVVLVFLLLNFEHFSRIFVVFLLLTLSR